MCKVTKKLLLFIFIITCGLHAEGLYEAISKENLKSFVGVESEGKGDSIGSLIKRDKHFYQVVGDKLQDQLNPGSQTSREQVFKLFYDYEKDHPTSEYGVLDLKTWQDLEFLCGPKSDPSFYLASKIDRTYTEMGRIALFEKLVNPLSPEKVQEQQNIVKELVENESLYNYLDAHLKDLKVPENAMLSFWGEDVFQDMMNQNGSHSLLPKKISKLFEHCEIIQEVRGRLKIINKITGQVMWLVGISAMFFKALKFGARTGLRLKCNDDDPIFEYFDDNKWMKKIDTASTWAGGAATTFGIFYLASQFFLSDETENLLSKAGGPTLPLSGMGKGVSVGLGTASALYQALWLPDVYHWLKGDQIITKHFYEKTIHVSTYVNSLRKMRTELLQYADSSSLGRLVKHVDDNFCELEASSKEMRQMLKNMNTRTFKGKSAYFFFYRGRMMVTFKLLMKQYKQLVGVMRSLGELDAQMSIARLYKEHQSKPVKYCFPEYNFSDRTSPSISVSDFWNPFIDADKVVANSIDVGSTYEQPQNIVITGPNAAGKSTITKGLITSIIMAQGLGIAPASSLKFTPFNKIATYLNITDDIAQGNSHFMAGALRARELMELAQNTKEGELSLIAADELFNGTTYKEGQAAAYSFIKQIGMNNPRNICVTATHFPSLTTLESTGHFKNYKVFVSEDENGKLQYPYKLVPGVADQIITFKILKEEGFGDKFLAEAENQLVE